MTNNHENYQDFFREELYGGFVSFLVNKLGNATVIALIGDEPLFTKKGVHTQLRRQFNEFLSQNPQVEKTFSKNDGKTFLLKGICGQSLLFPINCEDEDLMVSEDIRNPEYFPVEKNEFPRAGKITKSTCDSLKNQLLKGDWKEKRFLVPAKLVIHFKRGHALRIGKTTETYSVDSKQDIATMLFDIYKDKVAFAQCGKQKFQFVKRIQHAV